MSCGNLCQYSFDRGMSMSVTTSTEDVSLQVRQPAPGKARKPSPEAERTRRTQLATQRVLLVTPPILLAVFLLVNWYLSTTRGGVPSYILPTPGAVLSTLFDGLKSGLFLSNTLVTMQESLLGFCLAVIVALPMGYGLAKSRLFAATVQPYLAAGQAIPAIVIFPLLILWFGYGLLPIVILCTLVVLFPMVITTALGFQTIDRSLIDAARVEGASAWPMFARIE